MPWKPSAPGEIPTLGYDVIDWMAEELASPDDPDGKPFILTLEQEDFVLKWHAIDPLTGRFKYHRGLIGRPRGWGKSPFLAAIAAAEGLAPVVFDGWDADGQPVGRPWSSIRRPLIHIAAVSEDQTKNTWDALLALLEGPVVDDYPGLEPLGTMVNLPVGQILKVTSSARTVKGARTVLGIMDQTEEWVRTNGGLALAQNMRTNASKVGGRTLESPNAFIQGDGSVAEESAKYAADIAEGRARDDGLLYDNREGPADVDLTDRESIIAGLRWVYGDSSDHPDGCVLHDPPCKPGWSPIESNADMFWDPANDVQKLCADFLNQSVSESDSFVTRPEWLGCGPHPDDPLWPDWSAPAEVSKTDPVALGFDGSRGRASGVTDATALVAVRISDGLTWPVGVWEEPDGPEAEGWEVPEAEVEAVLDEFMASHRVVAFKADPAGWESNVARWEAKFGPRLVVGPKAHPISWHTGTRKYDTAKAIDALRVAVRTRELQHTGSAVLMRHMLNARVRMRSYGPLLFKAYPSSPRKIDAAYALTLAWAARTLALAVDTTPAAPRSSFIPARIR